MGDEIQAVVFDIGTKFARFGFAGEDAPKERFPTVVNLRKTSPLFKSTNIRDYFVGDEYGRCITYAKYPIKKGLIEDFDTIEKIWHSSFYNYLIVAPEEHPVLMTESPFNTNEKRMKTAEMMFEGFSVPSFHLINQSALSLYSAGRTTGIMMESGEEISCAVPIFEGLTLHTQISSAEIGGKDITSYLNKLMTDERGYSFTTTVEREIVRDIKEKLCFLSSDFDVEIQTAETKDDLLKSYELPDGCIIQIGTERFRCPEALFKPSMIGKEEMGFHELVNKSILSCYFDLRKTLYENIILGGGNTMFPGIQERMSREMFALASCSTRLKVIATPERNISAWIGGSIVASLSTFKDVMITRAEYEEIGPSIVNIKCF